MSRGEGENVGKGNANAAGIKNHFILCSGLWDL